jgi:hypothetical protein
MKAGLTSTEIERQLTSATDEQSLPERKETKSSARSQASTAVMLAASMNSVTRQQVQQLITVQQRLLKLQATTTLG